MSLAISPPSCLLLFLRSCSCNKPKVDGVPLMGRLNLRAGILTKRVDSISCSISCPRLSLLGAHSVIHYWNQNRIEFQSQFVCCATRIIRQDGALLLIFVKTFPLSLAFLSAQTPKLHATSSATNFRGFFSAHLNALCVFLT